MASINRRCYNFDQETGDPLPPHYGCPSLNCRFAHPDSPRWKDAAKSRLKRDRSPAASSSSRDTGRSPMKKLDRGWSDRSKYRPPSPPDRSTTKRTDRGSKETSSTWGASGSTWGQPSEPWGETSTKPSTTSGWGEPAKDSGWGEPAKDSGWGEPAKDSGWGEPSSSTVGWGQSSNSSTKPRPPSPPGPAPKEHSPYRPPPPTTLPPPLPSVSSRRSSLNISHLLPDSLNESETNAARPMSPVDARGSQTKESRSSSRKGKEPVARPAGPKSDSLKLYSSRISLLTEAVMIRNDYVQATRTLEARRKMQSTQKYHHVSENVQSRLDGFAQECEDKAQDLRTKLDDVLSKLVESEVWPKGIPEKEVPATDEAALKQMSEVEDRLTRLEEMVKEAEAEPSRKLAESMEEGEVPLVGTKRRRESMSDRRPEGLSSREVLNRVEQLEARTAEIDNQATQHANNVLEIVDARIDEKLEGLHITRPVPKDVEMADASASGFASGEGDVREQVSKLSNDLEGFATETAAVITKNTAIEVEMKQLRAENAALKIQIAENETSRQTLEASVDRNDRQLKAVLQAVEIIRESRPAVPAAIDARALEPMRKQILESVLADLDPALVALREHCEAAVTSAREETLKQVVAKLGRTAELVNIIYGYFGRSWQGKEGAPPLI